MSKPHVVIRSSKIGGFYAVVYRSRDVRLRGGKIGGTTTVVRPTFREALERAFDWIQRMKAARLDI